MTPSPAQPPGIYRGIPDAEYRSWPAISMSGLRVLGEQSPAAYRWQQAHPRPQSEAMLLGSLIDSMLLGGPGELAERYELADGRAWPRATCPECGAAPEAPCLGKKGEPITRCHSGRRELHDSGGRMVVDARTWARAQEIAEAVRRHPTAAPLVDLTDHQVSMLWIDPETGIALKGRLDLVRPGEYLADLKTCRAGAASPRQWARHAAGLAYHYQAAVYSDGWAALTGEALPWIWLAVETEPPYQLAVHQAADAWIWRGRDAYRSALRLYAHCLDTGEWPGYPEDPQLCEPPPWLGRGGEEVDQ